MGKSNDTNGGAAASGVAPASDVVLNVIRKAAVMTGGEWLVEHRGQVRAEVCKLLE